MLQATLFSFNFVQLLEFFLFILIACCKKIYFLLQSFNVSLIWEGKQAVTSLDITKLNYIKLN